MRKGFTLLELLITVAIISIVATAVVMVINPVETLSQARDGRRISEVSSIDEAITLALQQNPAIFEGFPKTVYLSLPDTSQTCDNYALPPLANGWKYNCVTKDKLMKVDGTGWLPIDFTSLTIRPMSVLPVDPINNKVKPTANSGGCSYYSYTPGWELAGEMESKKYAYRGAGDVESTDGGSATSTFEKGEGLSLMPREIENCQSVGVPTSWYPWSGRHCGPGDWEPSGSSYQYYNSWLIPGSGQVRLTKLWYWQFDQSLTPSESIQMAVYNSGSPDYARKSEIVTINGTGDGSCGGTSCYPPSSSKGGAGWIYKDLTTPITIDLGKVYIFGIGPGGGSSYSIGRVVFDATHFCDEYLPVGGYWNMYSGGSLRDPVPTGNSQGNVKAGYIGVSYEPL